MSKRVAILQSNYIPWKGYFDLINQVDEFVIYDDAQYTKNDWRNRNLIKTRQGLKWLTIPVIQTSLNQKIKETLIADPRWNKKHWSSICQNYSKSTYFQDYSETIEQLYMSCSTNHLSEVNYKFITAINSILDIRTQISRSSDYELEGDKTERLIGICKQAGANEYLSGPAAKCYLDLKLAKQEHIKVSWMDYSGYPKYPQLNSPFEHAVTVLDLLFNVGPDFKKYMKSFNLEN